MDIDYIAVGQRIRHFRRQKRFTQEELAFRIESTAAYISNIEGGKKKPSLDKLAEISEVLGVTVNDLIYTTAASVTHSLSDLTRINTCSPAEKQILANITGMIQTYITQ